MRKNNFFSASPLVLAVKDNRVDEVKRLITEEKISLDDIEEPYLLAIENNKTTMIALLGDKGNELEKTEGVTRGFARIIR